MNQKSKLALLTFCMIASVHSRTPRASETGAGLSTVSLDELFKRVRAHDSDAILEIGRRREKSIIPLLREQAKLENKSFGGAAASAQMALAKLGERVEMDQILAELRDENPAVQSDAVRKLTYIGGNEAVVVLGSLLADTNWRRSKRYYPSRRGPHGERPRSAPWYEPPAYMAARALAQVTGAFLPPENDFITESYLAQWQLWWADYKKTHSIKDSPGNFQKGKDDAGK